jgi:hypothetical protein
LTLHFNHKRIFLTYANHPVLLHSNSYQSNSCSRESLMLLSQHMIMMFNNNHHLHHAHHWHRCHHHHESLFYFTFFTPCFQKTYFNMITKITNCGNGTTCNTARTVHSQPLKTNPLRVVTWPWRSLVLGPFTWLYWLMWKPSLSGLCVPGIVIQRASCPGHDTTQHDTTRHDTHFTVLSHKHTAISPDKSCRGKAEKAGVSLQNQVPSIPYRKTGPPSQHLICGEGTVRRHLETSRAQGETL